MIGIEFHEFIGLLILSLIASSVVHYLICLSLPRRAFLEGVEGFVSKWVAGFAGARTRAGALLVWKGVVSNGWFRMEGVWVTPALLGAFAGAFAIAAA